MNLLVSFSIYTPWSPLPSRLLQKATRLPCGKKLTPAGNQAWNASKNGGFPIPISSLDSQKKTGPRLPWFPPCRKNHGFEKGRKRALVRPVPCQVPGQPRSWKNMAIGLVSREILLENFVFAWFYHGFYLSKWLNMWVSWKKMPKNRYAQRNANETGDIPLLCLITAGLGISNGDALQLWFPTVGKPVISISLGLGV